MNRVLIIEDSEAQCFNLSRILRKRKLSPQYTHTFAEGLELARQETWALIILDLGLPDSAREDTARRIPELASAADPRNPVPVIALTGDHDQKLRELCNNAAADVILKPADVHEVIGEALKLIERRAPSREVSEQILEEHRERLVAPVIATAPPITHDTKVSLSLAQMCTLVGVIITAAFAVAATTLGMRASITDLTTQHVYAMKETNKRLDSIDAALKENAEGDRQRDKETKERVADWTPWRWSVTLDLRELGRATKTPIQTRQ